MKRILLVLCVVVAALGAGCSNAGGPIPNPSPSSTTTTSSTTVPPDFEGTVWVIGDSISVGAKDELATLHPDTVINAKTGRRFDQGIRELTQMLDQSAAPDVLVFALGTNNGTTPEQVEQVLALASAVERIVFVNVAVPRGWETDTNSALAQASAAFDKVTVVDWYSLAARDGSLLRKDGYHPSADGSIAWADLIGAAIHG